MTKVVRLLAVCGLAALLCAAVGVGALLSTSTRAAPGTGPSPAPAAVLAGNLARGDRTISAPNPTRSGTGAGAAADGLELGVFTGQDGPGAAIDLDERTRGGIGVALEFLPRNSWTSIVNIGVSLRQWTASGFTLVLAVPLLPGAGATLAAGAAGAYDTWFSILSSRLVQMGLGDVILMLGWQPDDRGTPWFVANAKGAAAYVAYWRQVERVMNAVSGAHFVFEWDAGDAGSSPVSPASMYPGNRYVDLIATDAFDTAPPSVPASAQWTDVLYGQYGPAWMWTFAVAHDKPMAIAMWGEVPRLTGGSGDNPDYVGQFLAWAGSAGVVMAVLWDSGYWSLTHAFPAAAAAFSREVAGSKWSTGGPGRRRVEARSPRKSVDSRGDDR